VTVGERRTWTRDNGRWTSSRRHEDDQYHRFPLLEVRGIITAKPDQNPIKADGDRTSSGFYPV
jgi:hypothetical protein